MQEQKAGKGRCAIGVDFGTTNSAVAIYDGTTVVSVDFPLDDGDVIPSAVYVDRDWKQVLIGRDAVDTYLRANESRVVKLTRELLGDIQMHCADQAFTFNIFGMTDSNMPGRLLCSLKRWLGDAGLEDMDVFGRRFRLTLLIQMILQRLATGVGVMEGERTYFGRPVDFGGSNTLAEDRLTQSADGAGFRSISFYPEPVAAAVSYTLERNAKPGEHFLCFDFGGGTLDLCVLEYTCDGFRIRSTHGIVLGGDFIDKLIFRNKVFPELGDLCPMKMTRKNGEEMKYRFHLFPYESFLLNWQLSARLNQPALLEELARGIQAGGETGRKLSRLYAVIRQNQSYKVIRAIEAAKIQLSDETEATIEIPEVDLAARISRTEFEEYLQEIFPRIRQAVRQTVQQAGITMNKIDEVVCTGGSSRIPAVRKFLGDLIGRPVVEHATFTSVASGLAIANYHNYASPLDQ